jgi:hypothetical protein
MLDTKQQPRSSNIRPPLEMMAALILLLEEKRAIVLLCTVGLID